MPLSASEILPQQDESLDVQVMRTQALATRLQTQLALSVGSLSEDAISWRSIHRKRPGGQRVKFNSGRHNLETRQKVVAMMAMNMLRRWLHGSEVSTGHGWIDVLETIKH